VTQSHPRRIYTLTVSYIVEIQAEYQTEKDLVVAAFCLNEVLFTLRVLRTTTGKLYNIAGVVTEI
jgi:hypothetical protein